MVDPKEGSEVCGALRKASGHVVPGVASLTDAVGTALSLAQHRPLAAQCWAGLGEAADVTVVTRAARAGVGLPGLGRQEQVAASISAVAGWVALGVGGRWWRWWLFCGGRDRLEATPHRTPVSLGKGMGVRHGACKSDAPRPLTPPQGLA